MTPLRLVAVVVSAALFGGALAIGGGVPLSPGQIAAATRSAADNSRAAAANTELAARDTRALATIARNVGSQVRSSRLLLETQTRLHESSREGVERAKLIARGIARVRQALDAMRRRIAVLTSFSEDAATAAADSSSAADRLARTLRALRARFDEVVRQSRRLNRKARGFDEARDGPG